MRRVSAQIWTLCGGHAWSRPGDKSNREVNGGVPFTWTTVVSTAVTDSEATRPTEYMYVQKLWECACFNGKAQFTERQYTVRTYVLSITLLTKSSQPQDRMDYMHSLHLDTDHVSSIAAMCEVCINAYVIGITHKRTIFHISALDDALCASITWF